MPSRESAPSLTPRGPLRGPVLAGATDTHVHVFDPTRHPFASERSYTPPPAPFDALRQHLGEVGAERVVLVQPSVYGSTNACLLDALGQFAPGTARGIAVVDLDSTPRERLVELDRAGVRGIRLNFEVRHNQDFSFVAKQLARAAALVDLPGWCVQVHCGAAVLGAILDAIVDFRVPVVLDHFAGLRTREPALVALQSQVVERLLDTGRVYVKLSAFYRASDLAPAYQDLQPLAQRWIAAHPARLLWGSDWPHTGGGAGGTVSRDPAHIEPFRPIDTSACLRSLKAWCASDEVFKRVLVDNPSELYGFKPSAS
ncbi:MAG: hypothetical protein RLZZ598_1109 [Pseudomonadota bacterium]